MPKPVCVPCARFFKPKRTGLNFIEGLPKEPGAQPGTAEPEKWQDYKLWSGDMWQCDGCGAVILAGFGLGPIADHHEPDFAKKAAKLGANFRVNDV